MEKLLLPLCVLLSFCANLYGWGNKKTRPALTDNALGISTADSYLKSQIGLDDGILTDLYWNFPTYLKGIINVY